MDLTVMTDDERKARMAAPDAERDGIGGQGRAIGAPALIAPGRVGGGA
jgi:hypothetical protein